MIFLSTLIALLIERFFHWTQLRHWRWFGKYQQMLGGRIVEWPPFSILLVLILPPVLLVALVSVLLSAPLLAPLKILFSALILLYSFGPENLWAQTYRSIDELNKNNLQAAQTSFGISETENTQGFHRAFLRTLFNAANQRIFAVIFWFVILGPAGAILYRIMALCCNVTTFPISTQSKQFLNILDWVPARILTFFFALAGNFTRVFNEWRKNANKGLDSNQDLLYACGTAAIDINAESSIPETGTAEKDALSLFDRSLVITLVILALIVLITVA